MEILVGDLSACSYIKNHQCEKKTFRMRHLMLLLLNLSLSCPKVRSLRPFPAWPLSNFSLELNAPICTGSVRKWSSLQMQQALQWWAALQQGCDLPPPALNCYSSCLLFLEKNLPILALPSSWNELYETALGARCNHLCFSISLFWPKKTLQILFKRVLVLSVCGFAPSRHGSCHRVKWPYRGQVPGGMIF